MGVRKKKVFGRIITAVLGLAMLLSLIPVDVNKAQAATIPADVSKPSSGCVFIAMRGQYASGAAAAVKKINQLRYEACKQGIKMNGKKLTLKDYVPIKWSAGLEKIARIRAAESSVTMYHQRLNGKNVFSFKYPGSGWVTSEVIAWNWSEGMTIWANTTGLMQKWFGVSSTGQYLLFDEYWGNSRGFSWSITAETFAKMPLWRKLTGVGPDCYSVYCYADTDLAGRLHHYFRQNQTLTNAHNEFLNQLFCTGGIGFAAFVGFLAAAVCRFWKNREKEPMALMGLLAVLVYGAHNFFCYQQVCCIPFLFLLIAMLENLVREAAEK